MTPKRIQISQLEMGNTCGSTESLRALLGQIMSILKGCILVLPEAEIHGNDHVETQVHKIVCDPNYDNKEEYDVY